jgi:hypothetical protein
MDYAIKDESMETINASSAEGLFPQTIDYIELERHNFDIGNEESNKDQEEAEEKNNTVETKQVEADDKQVEKESALTKEVEEDEKNDVASASTAVETQPNTEQMDVELKSNEEKQVDKQVEKQEVKMDLD